MATPIMSFKATINPLDKKKLVLTDTSDPQDTVVSTKDWYIQKSDGTIDHIPVVTFANPSVEYTLDKDRVVIAKLVYNGSSENPNSGYSLSVNVVAAPLLDDSVNDLRKVFLPRMETKSCDAEKLVNSIRLVNTFMDSANDLASTDVVEAQKSLDFGNKYANEFKTMYK